MQPAQKNRFRHNEQKATNFLFYLYIYFIIDFFLHLSQRIPGYGMIRPTLLLVVLITILMFAQKDRLPNILDIPILKPVLLLITYIFVTILFVTWPGSVLHNIPDFVKAVVFLFFTALLVDTDRRLRIFLFVFCTCQVFRVLEPLYMNITSGYWGGATYLGEGVSADRLSGAPLDIIGPNGLGFVIVTALPYLYYLLWQSGKYLNKLIFLLITPTILYALVLTMSRGAFLALLVVVWIIFKNSKYKLLLAIAVFVAMLVGWNYLSDVHKDRYLSLISDDAQQSATAHGRVEGMINEFVLVLKNPIIGNGLGTSMEAKVHAGQGMQISHNLYAEVLLETGIVGFIIFFSYLKAIYKQYKKNRMMMEADLKKDTFAWRLNMAMGAIFWMYAIYSINYYGLSTYYWYMFGGMMIAYSRINFPAHSSEKHFVREKS